jgi:hypothetical protein
LKNAIDGNFMRKEHQTIWQVASTAEEAIDMLYHAPAWNRELRKIAAI